MTSREPWPGEREAKKAALANDHTFKPCPFCGSGARAACRGGYFQEVICPNSCMDVRAPEKEAAAKRWNILCELAENFTFCLECGTWDGPHEHEHTGDDCVRKEATMTSRKQWPGEKEARERLQSYAAVHKGFNLCMSWLESRELTRQPPPDRPGVWEYGDHNGLTVMRFPNIPPNEAAWSGYLPTHWRYLGPCGTIAQDPEPELPPCDKGHKPIKSGGTILCYHADDEYGCMHLLMDREHWLRLFKDNTQ